MVAAMGWIRRHWLALLGCISLIAPLVKWVHWLIQISSSRVAGIPDGSAQ
jgi:hypothetical protein